jgi:hypothetical protein
VTDLDTAIRAYLAGHRGAERLVPLLHSGMTHEEQADILFRDEDIDLVETLAAHGNDLAALFLTRERQRRIEDNLDV